MYSVCTAVRGCSPLPHSSSLCTCSPGGRLSSHAACFWVSLILGGLASKDHHSRPRAGWREGILKVGPLAVQRGSKGFGGQGGSGLLPGGGIAFSSQLLSLWGEASALSQLRQPSLFQLVV